MKRHFIYSVMVVFGLLSMSCASEEPETVCDASYIATCLGDLTGYTYCDVATGQLVSDICANGCDIATGSCRGEACTPETYPTTCLDDSTLGFCSNNFKKTQACAVGQICRNGSCMNDDSCTEATYPATCVNETTREFCHNGQKATQQCDLGCENGVCKTASEPVDPEPVDPEPVDPEPVDPEPVDPDVCDSATFVPKCDTPEYVVTCVNNKIVRTECSNGQICNSELKNKSCKTPNFNDACDPSTFSEICYGDTQARICDETTRKVITVDCTKTYGDDYKCDIKEDFYSAGVDVVMCYSRDEDCKTEGAESYEYCWAEDSTGFRHFYREIYICAEFNTGFHTYFNDIEECSESKCGQNSISNPCDFELDY